MTDQAGPIDPNEENLDSRIDELLRRVAHVSAAEVPAAETLELPMARQASPALAARGVPAPGSVVDGRYRVNGTLGEGAMGVVLNRPLNKRLGELGGDFALGPLADVPVFDGGPVEKRQLIICAWRPQPGADGDDDGETLQLLFGLDPDRAAELAGQEGVQLRAFLGYAGWSGGQLEGELERDTWVVADLEPEIVRHRPDESLWRSVLGGLDPRWRLLASEPDDPGLN